MTVQRVTKMTARNWFIFAGITFHADPAVRPDEMVAVVYEGEPKRIKKIIRFTNVGDAS